MEAEYDRMADEYDATRDAATQQEIDAIAGSLSGSRSILDVGVGTGRFAKPLSDLGFEVTGVDVSRRMLLKAGEKGLDRLVLGDAYSLPFRAKSFDGAIVVHLLHIVVDWARVVREIGRVTRGNVAAIFRVPQVPQDSTAAGAGGAIASQQVQPGVYPVRTQHRMWENDQALKSAVAPMQLTRIRDETVELSVADAIRRLEAKRSMGAQMVPPELKRAMIERLVAARGGQVVHRRIVEDLAVWKAEQLEALSQGGRH